MKKVIAIGLTVLSLVGCADATRTVPVLVLDERTIKIPFLQSITRITLLAR